MNAILMLKERDYWGILLYESVEIKKLTISLHARPQVTTNYASHTHQKKNAGWEEIKEFQHIHQKHIKSTLPRPLYIWLKSIVYSHITINFEYDSCDHMTDFFEWKLYAIQWTASADKLTLNHIK